MVAWRAGDRCLAWRQRTRRGGLPRTQTTIGEGGLACGGAGVCPRVGEAAARWRGASGTGLAAHSLVHVARHDARHGGFVSSRAGALRASCLVISFHRRAARGRRAVGSGRGLALGQLGASGRRADGDWFDAGAASQSGGAGWGDAAAFAHRGALGAQCGDRHALADRCCGEWRASVRSPGPGSTASRRAAGALPLGTARDRSGDDFGMVS